MSLSVEYCQTKVKRPDVTQGTEHAIETIAKTVGELDVLIEVMIT